MDGEESGGGAAHGWEEEGVGVKAVKRVKIWLFYPAEGVKGSYRVRPVRPVCGPVRPVAPKVRENSRPDYPGEFPEYPGIAQSIRAKIQTIRELTMKKS